MIDPLHRTHPRADPSTRDVLAPGRRDDSSAARKRSARRPSAGRRPVAAAQQSARAGGVLAGGRGTRASRAHMARAGGV